MLGAGRSKDVKLIMEVEPNLIGGLQVEWGYTDPQKRYVSLKPFERSGATDPTGTGWHRPYESNSSLAS
jgi:hypothetical protein